MDETIEITAIREFEEETSLKGIVLKRLYTFSEINQLITSVSINNLAFIK